MRRKILVCMSRYTTKKKMNIKQNLDLAFKIYK